RRRLVRHEDRGAPPRALRRGGRGRRAAPHHLRALAARPRRPRQGVDHRLPPRPARGRRSAPPLPDRARAPPARRRHGHRGRARARRALRRVGRPLRPRRARPEGARAVRAERRRGDLSPPLRRIGLGLVASVFLIALALLGVERGLDWALLTKSGVERNAAIADHDELWHLATGERILEAGRVPDKDPFTFTAGDVKWTNTNWLAQVVLAALYRLGGIELDWVLGVALWLGAVLFVHLRARRRAGSAWAASPVAFYALVCLRRASEVRPQGWTFLLLAAALFVLRS